MILSLLCDGPETQSVAWAIHVVYHTCFLSLGQSQPFVTWYPMSWKSVHAFCILSIGCLRWRLSAIDFQETWLRVKWSASEQKAALRGTCGLCLFIYFDLFQRSWQKPLLLPYLKEGFPQFGVSLLWLSVATGAVNWISYKSHGAYTT